MITACIVKYCKTDESKEMYNRTLNALYQFMPVIEFNNTDNNIGLVKARNILLNRVQTDAVLFCDFDIKFIGDLQLIDFITMDAAAKLGVVSARVHKPDCICDLTDDRLVKMPHLQNCFNVFKTKHLLDIGGYDERFHTYCADWDLIKRLDRPMYQFNGVNVVHYASSAGSKEKADLCKHDFDVYTKKWGNFERFPESDFICNSDGIC